MYSLVVIKIFKNDFIFSPQTLYLNNYCIIRFNIVIGAKNSIYKFILRVLKNIIKWLLSYLRLKFRFFGVFWAGRLGGEIRYIINIVFTEVEKSGFVWKT